MKNQWYHQLTQTVDDHQSRWVIFRNNEQKMNRSKFFRVSSPLLQHSETRFVGLCLFLLIFPTLIALPGVSHFPLSKWQIQTHLVLIGSFAAAASDASFCSLSLLSISMSPGASLLCLRVKQSPSLPETVDALGAFRCSAELDWYWKVTEEKQYRNRERAGSGERKQLDVPRGKRNERTDGPRAESDDRRLRPPDSLTQVRSLTPTANRQKRKANRLTSTLQKQFPYFAPAMR